MQVLLPCEFYPVSFIVPQQLPVFNTVDVSLFWSCCIVNMQ